MPTRTWIVISSLGPLLLVLNGARSLRLLSGEAGVEAFVVGWIALLWPVLLRACRVRRGLDRVAHVVHDPFARIGAAIVMALFFVALFAPLIASSSPGSLGDPVADRYQPPSGEHWMGTDLLGRDVFARVVHGARVSLGIAVASVLISLGLGTLVGAFAGWRGGWVDGVLMRATDLALAFPRVFLVLLLVAFTEPTPVWIVLVLGLTGWMGVARLVRGQVLQIRDQEYVLAARSLGIDGWRILRVHVLPQTLGPVIAISTLRVGNAILAESFLSFLGLGVHDPWVSWGLLVRAGRDMLLGGWWLATFPGLAIVATVVGFNLLGDGLRDVADPRHTPRPSVLEE